MQSSDTTFRLIENDDDEFVVQKSNHQGGWSDWYTSDNEKTALSMYERLIRSTTIKRIIATSN